jgi:hypothetical protein
LLANICWDMFKFFASKKSTTCLPPISCPHGSWAPMARENAPETTSS